MNDILLADILERVTKLAKPDQPIYLTGGALRDRLLGNISRDLDFARHENSIEIARQVADDCGGDFYVMDAERGIARVLLQGESGKRTVLDFADLRASSVEEDLALRDFSINAMASDLLHPEEIIDPLNARRDIQTHTLRMCSPTCFQDDPVRILRAVRFAVQLDFSIQPETIDRLKEAVFLLSKPSIERMRDELFHILEGRHVSQAASLLEALGILPGLLPEVAALVGLQQPGHHTHDTWQHTLSVLKYFEQILDPFLSAAPLEGMHAAIQTTYRRLQPLREEIRAYLNEPISHLRSLRSLLMLAALMHDVGKPAARKLQADGTVTFIGHDELGADLAKKRAVALALSNDEVNLIEGFIRNHMHIHLMAKEEHLGLRRAAYQFFHASGWVGAADCLFSLADLLGTYEEKIDPQRWEQGLAMCEKLLDAWFRHRHVWIQPPVLLNGDDLQQELNLLPGKQIGQLLERLEKAQAVGEVTNRAEALAAVKTWREEGELKKESDG